MHSVTRRRLVRCGISALVGIALFRPAVASACGDVPADVCSNVIVLPKTGATIPSNTPALAIGGSGAVSVELHENDGTLVPSALRPDPDSPSRQLLVPAAPLVAGTSYEVVWPCQDSTSAKSSFSSIAAEPMPTTTGTAAFDTMFRGEVDTCVGAAHADPNGGYVFLPVHLTPAADLRDFASVVTYVWEIDGHPAAVVRTDRGEALWMRCTTGTESETFKLRIRSIIPGATSQPEPFEADVHMSCAPSTWDANSAVHDSKSEPTASSCALRAVHHRSTTNLAALVFGAGALLIRRKRWRRCEHTQASKHVRTAD